MDKKDYEGIKELKNKVKTGKANYQERNILKIIEKRMKKGKRVYINKLWP